MIGINILEESYSQDVHTYTPFPVKDVFTS